MSDELSNDATRTLFVFEYLDELVSHGLMLGPKRLTPGGRLEVARLRAAGLEPSFGQIKDTIDALIASGDLSLDLLR